MKRAYRRKFHYIYRTTCTITGKYYLGMHSTDNLDDGYVGSGKRLWYSINKHGKENHVVEILEHYFTREWLAEREAALVCEDQLVDPMCMNLKIGGQGGFDHITEEHRSIAAKKRVSKQTEESQNKKRNTRINNGSNAKQSAMVLHRWELNRDEMLAHGVNFRKAGQLPESKARQIEVYQQIGHQQGDKNSQFGSKWMHKENEVKKFKLYEVDNKLTEGWFLGRNKRM